MNYSRYPPLSGEYLQHEFGISEINMGNDNF